MLGMLHTQPTFRRLLAAATFAPLLAASSLGGCGAGVMTEDCQAALARCGMFHATDFCRASPSECTIAGQPYVETEGLFILPPNQTITIDLSSVSLNERAVDLLLSLCSDSHGSIEDFQIQLDGFDVSPEGMTTRLKQEFFGFPGHTGTPRTLEVTWKGTRDGEIPEKPAPEVCVTLRLQDISCVEEVQNRECLVRID